LRSGAQCTLGTVEQLTYDEYVRSLPNPSYLIVLSLSPLPGAAILQFPLPIVFAAIDRLLGGTGDSLSPKRPLTEIESNLMRSVVDRTLRELEYAYETLVRVEAEIVQQEFNPQFAQIAAPSDMAMVVSFDTRIGEKHGNATICVPFSTMQPVLESLASQSLFQDHRGQDPVLWQQQLERALARVSVQTCVRFADVELSSAEIVGLQVGDIVPLDHPIELPVTISVDGVSCNRAVIGRRGKRLACLVVDGDQEHSA
jgi:flagellar motor switch protein FliM